MKRVFATLIESLDAQRYHVWVFYSPSGLPLDKLGKIVALVVQKLAAVSPNMRFALVAPSMGALVGRRAVNELCRSGSGYGQTHVGILSDKAALTELSDLLDATCSPAGAGK